MKAFSDTKSDGIPIDRRILWLFCKPKPLTQMAPSDTTVGSRPTRTDWPGAWAISPGTRIISSGRSIICCPGREAGPEAEVYP